MIIILFQFSIPFNLTEEGFLSLVDGELFQQRRVKRLFWLISFGPDLGLCVKGRRGARRIVWATQASLEDETLQHSPLQLQMAEERMVNVLRLRTEEKDLVRSRVTPLGRKTAHGC